MDRPNRVERNLREQHRVKILRGAFQELKEVLPINGNVKTNLEILRGATGYIKYLELKVQNIKAREAASDSYQARPSCRFAKGQQEVSYIAQPVQELKSKPHCVWPSSNPACDMEDWRSACDVEHWCPPRYMEHWRPDWDAEDWGRD